MEIAAALLIYNHSPDFNGLFLLPDSYGFGLYFNKPLFFPVCDPSAPRTKGTRGGEGSPCVLGVRTSCSHLPFEKKQPESCKHKRPLSAVVPAPLGEAAGDCEQAGAAAPR